MSDHPLRGTRYVLVVRLDQILDDRAMSLAKLAELSGISRKSLDKLKNGRATGFVWPTVLAICDVLDCDPGELITRRLKTEEEMRTPPETPSIPSMSADRRKVSS